MVVISATVHIQEDFPFDLYMHILPPPSCYSPALGKKTRQSKCSRWGDSLLSLKLWFHDFLSPLSYRQFHGFLWSSKRPRCIRDTLERPTFSDVGETFRAPVPFVLRRVVMGFFMPWLSSWQRFWSQKRPIAALLMTAPFTQRMLRPLYKQCIETMSLNRLGAIVIVAAQPFAFVSLMLENIIVSDTWSNIGWHLDSPVLSPTCVSKVSRMKTICFFASIEIEWINEGLDGPRVAETLFAWHLAAFKSLQIWWGQSPSLSASLRRFLVTLAFPAAWLVLRITITVSAVEPVAFSQKLMKTRGQSESARGAVPRVLRGGFLSLPSLRLYRGLTIPRLSHPVPWFLQQGGQNWRNGRKTGQALKLEGVEIVNMFFVCAEGSLRHVGTWVYCVFVCLS